METFHKENPLLPGIPREELRAAVGRRVKTEIVSRGAGGIGKAKQSDVAGRTGEEARSGDHADAGRSARERANRAGICQGRPGRAVRERSSGAIGDGKPARGKNSADSAAGKSAWCEFRQISFFTGDALGRLPGLLQNYKKSKGERIGVPTFKELTGITRKYAIPLLEYLDRQRLTRRMGDERVIL